MFLASPLIAALTASLPALAGPLADACNAFERRPHQRVVVARISQRLKHLPHPDRRDERTREIICPHQIAQRPRRRDAIDRQRAVD